jgi:outer membrane protein assembly factor BamB
MLERQRGLRLALLLCGLSACGLAGAADWPRFRGPNGAGTAADKDVPVRWAAKDVLWKAALPGVGHSSPVVVGGRIYLQSATPKERLLICLDAAKGTVLWQKAAPGGKGTTHVKNSLASSTPAADGERVYAVFWDGKRVGLFAYDLKGEPLWKQDLGAFTSQHGPGFSPIVHDGKVIVYNDQDGSAALLAFDAKTGRKAWQAERLAFRSCYSTPFVLEQGRGAGQLIVASTAGISGYDPNSGAEAWHYTWSFPDMPLRTVASPVAADGLVYATCGDGRGDRGMIAVRLGGKGDVTKTHLAYRKDSGTPYVPTPLAHGGHLYTVTDDGAAVCYVAKTGAEVWRRRLDARVAKVSASPVLIDGKVYAADERGEVYVFEASPAAFKLLGKSSVGEGVFATPAVADGRLYVRGRNHLFCIGKPAAR